MENAVDETLRLHVQRRLIADVGNADVPVSHADRLQLCCRRLIWLNPLLGSTNYQPLARGMRTALPYVDDFLPVHNLASLEQLGQLLVRLQQPSMRAPLA